MLLAGLAILVYLNSLGNGFAFDDIGIILENPTVHHFTDPLRIWLTPYWPGADALARGLYRPLTIQIMALQWAVGDGAPVVFHLLNVTLHAATSVLVYRVLRVLVGWRSAWVAGLLFAVHPVHVEAVANGVGQAEILSSALVMGAVLLHAGRPLHGDPGLRRQILIPVLFLCAVLTKENAIVLPALLLAVDVAQGRLKRRGYVASVGKVAVLLLGVASVYLVFRAIVLGGTLSGNAAWENQFLLDPATRIRTALSVWPQYARLLFVPFRLSAMYDPATILPSRAVTPSVVVGGVVLLFILVATFRPRAWPAVGLGSAWFLATILPVSNLIIPIGTVLAERTLYLPSVAVAIWTAYAFRWGWSRTGRRVLARWTLAGATALLMLTFGVRTWLRNPVWANNEVLFETTLRDHPENFRAQWFRAQRLVREGDSLASIPHWHRAFEIYPGNTGFLTSYAHFLLGQGALEEAAAMADRALELRATSPNGLFVRGLIDLAQGRSELARGRIQTLEELGFSAMATQLLDSLQIHSRPDTAEGNVR